MCWKGGQDKWKSGLQAGAALVVLFLIINMFSLSLKLLWNGIWRGGAAVAVQYAGRDLRSHHPHPFCNGLVAGFFGIPGVIFILLVQLMGH